MKMKFKSKFEKLELGKLTLKADLEKEQPDPIVDFFKNDSRFKVDQGVDQDGNLMDNWWITPHGRFHTHLEHEGADIWFVGTPFPLESLLAEQLQSSICERTDEISRGKYDSLPELADLYFQYEVLLEKEDVPYEVDYGLDSPEEIEAIEKRYEEYRRENGLWELGPEEPGEPGEGEPDEDNA